MKGVGGCMQEVWGEIKGLFFLEEFSVLQVWRRNEEGEATEGLLDRFEISMLRTYENNTWQMLTGWYHAPSYDFSLSML